jgi:hypothetical protein
VIRPLEATHRVAAVERAEQKMIPHPDENRRSRLGPFLLDITSASSTYAAWACARMRTDATCRSMRVDGLGLLHEERAYQLRWIPVKMKRRLGVGQLEGSRGEAPAEEKLPACLSGPPGSVGRGSLSAGGLTFAFISPIVPLD